MKKLILLACLALGACQDAEAFRKGDAVEATAQLDSNDQCIVWVKVDHLNGGVPDVGIHARIISAGCSK